MDKRVTILKGVMRHPVEAFREIGENGKKYLPGALVIVIFAFFISYLFHPILFPLQDFLMGGFTLFLYLIFFYFIGRALGGEAGFTGLVSALGYAYLPSVFFSLVFEIGVRKNIETLRELMALRNLPQEQIAEKALPLFKDLITPTTISLVVVTLLLGIWGLILTVYACRETRKFGTGKAIGTVILTIFAAGAVTSLLGFLT